MEKDSHEKIMKPEFIVQETNKVIFLINKLNNELALQSSLKLLNARLGSTYLLHPPPSQKNSSWVVGVLQSMKIS